MKRPIDDVVMKGLVGGILAGVVVATWFLVLDVLAGQPLHTPAVLAHFFFQREVLTVTPELVAFYSVLHLGVFALLGVATAWALAWFGAAPGLLLGAVFGVIVLDLVFYGALLASGAGIFSVLPGHHVLAANLLGGMALMAYLHRAGREPTPLGWAVLRGHPVLTRGIVTGLLGAVTVAVWFLALDVMAGEPLRTPAALGAALFFGAQAVTDYAPSLGLVTGYTMVHVGLFVAFGVGLAAAARELERVPQLVLMFALACIVLEALVLPALAIRAEWVLGTVQWWSVAVGNALAVGAMGWHIWRTHPGLRRALHRPAAVHT